MGYRLSSRGLAGRTATPALRNVDWDDPGVFEAMPGRVAGAVGGEPRMEAALDGRAALDGADYVMTMFQVGGYRPATVTDFEIPKRWGLRQTIGDTVGIGGIMRGLPAIPLPPDLCPGIEELCPHPLLLQYVDPMAAPC